MSSCHCRFLEPEFWHSSEVTVLYAPGGSAPQSTLFDWVKGQKELQSHILFQTSGSTGRSKWVAISKTAMLASARMVNRHIGLTDSARWGLVLPHYHVGGFGVLVRSFLTGADCAVYHGKWDPVRFSAFVSKNRCEYISLVPTQVVDLVRARCVVPPSVKSVIVGGGALSDKVYQGILELGWPVLRSYGMTESASQIATGDVDGGLEVLDAWELRTGDDGVLQWKGVAGMTAYLYEGHDGFSLVDPYRDGWFTTSDLAEIHGGALNVVGRADQRVKILGELVDLASFETELSETMGTECVIIAVDDERRGKLLFPVVEGEDSYNLDAYSGLKALEPLTKVERFPRSSLGKILRKQLQEGLNL
ncbi:AMP-binding protein [Rubritalea marina]|uniref:AMP-binding protein n=1 Tax=Rubritalea marina TaxID=361055 RepID=UPI00036BE982|nr:AMP-binding protein [Rubritalea marina]